MLLTVNNKKYKEAQSRGFKGSFAQYAQLCNEENSRLVSLGGVLPMYFNDNGPITMPASKATEKPFMIDITENRKQMAEISDNTIYGNLSEMMKLKTTFAMGGAVVGFVYAVSQRTSWVPYTIGGMVIGALAGWGVSSIKQD